MEMSAINNINNAKFQAQELAIENQKKKLQEAAKGYGIDPKTLDKIDEASKEYEAVFLNEMLGYMFKEINFGGMYSEGDASSEIYKDFLVDEFAQSIARNGGIGLAADIKAELIKLQTSSY